MSSSQLGLVDDFVTETRADMLRVDVARTTAGQAILALPPEAQVDVVLDVVGRQARDVNAHGSDFALKSLLAALLRKKLPFTVDHLEQLVDELISVNRHAFLGMLSPAGIMAAIEGLAELPESLEKKLRDLHRKLTGETLYADERKIMERVEKLCAGTSRRRPISS